MIEIKKNSIITIRIEALSYGGRGIGKYNGIVVFVSHTVPGDIVKVNVTKRKESYLEADLLEIEEPSPIRIPAPCPLFGVCGGCNWQNIPYEKQVVYKEEIARSLVEHIGKQTSFVLHPVISSPLAWKYRNKVDFTFGKNPEGNLILGFHKPGIYHEILDVKECLLHPEIFNDLMNEMKDFCREKGLTPYDPRDHCGNVRHFILRCSGNDHPEGKKGVIAILLTAQEELPGRDELVDRLRSRCPALTGFIHGLNEGKADIARMDKPIHVWGDDYLHDRLDRISFRLSALSFFQTNTRAAEPLYETTRRFLSLTGKENLLDAYCGVGSIGIYCAHQAKRVYGIEILREAVWDARKNAAMNRLDNCLFLCGEFRKTLPILLNRIRDGIQRVVMDPPRGGLDKKSLRSIIELRAPVLAYVSCNPTTFARDAEILFHGGYRITDIQPVDMFPHTYHIEMVSRFEMEKPF
ncbi:23S rRNA (uracil(1939)-C(5))-methyltransferase RlmD [Candidatus Sumerlaeota bacterium]|nr:23S rRNA (uracil(1939)-C(5))-methyltransferase RlmD [Candidatus Sumerlaeota bacterium]